MSYVIKQVPDDFVVREMPPPPVQAVKESGQGRFAYYRLTKRVWTTQSAVSQAARAFRKNPRFVNFSGNKDKQAVTEQFISMLHGPRRGLELQGGDITLEYLGQGRERLNLGASPGNEFEITVRNLHRGCMPSPLRQVPNYFDEQRFGMNLNNHLVGRLLVLKDFESACGLVPETRERLGKSPRDYVGALRSLPKRVLRIYAHAYQSWLWNLTVSRYMEGFSHRYVSWPLGRLAIPEGPIENVGVPLVGYDSEVPDPVIPAGLNSAIKDVLSEEKIILEDFRVRQFSEFDLSGGHRDLMAEPADLSFGPLQEDDLNPGMKKCLVSFSLKSGSYATMVIRAIFS